MFHFLKFLCLCFWLFSCLSMCFCVYACVLMFMHLCDCDTLLCPLLHFVKERCYTHKCNFFLMKALYFHFPNLAWNIHCQPYKPWVAALIKITIFILQLYFAHKRCWLEVVLHLNSYIKLVSFVSFIFIKVH